LPILRRAGARATFFVPTAFPDGGRLFFWDRIVLLMRRCRGPVDLDYPAAMTLDPVASPARAAAAVARAIKRTPGVSLERVWDALERAAGVSLDPAEERALAERTVMGWEEVRALRDAGMDVQSHSHAHRVFNTMTPREIVEDLRCSRRTLRDRLGVDPRAVAYPVGYRLTGARRSAVVEAGFEVGFTNGTGLCDTLGCDALNVPRLSMAPARIGSAYKLHLLAGEPRRAGARPSRDDAA
jgi:peptidoglycan/xylan/chitin deacetylase (PgdA/CDA1 family)